MIHQEVMTGWACVISSSLYACMFACLCMYFYLELVNSTEHFFKFYVGYESEHE